MNAKITEITYYIEKKIRFHYGFIHSLSIYVSVTFSNSTYNVNVCKNLDLIEEQEKMNLDDQLELDRAVVEAKLIGINYAIDRIKKGK